MCYGTIDDLFPCIGLMLKRLAYYTAFGYIVIAVVDRLFQGRNFTKEMMMTKDEVKREYKEMEGSSEVKQAQRQFRDEILNSPNPVNDTKNADVVVTTPTHLAIGIRYRIDEAPPAPNSRGRSRHQCKADKGNCTGGRNTNNGKCAAGPGAVGKWTRGGFHSREPDRTGGRSPEIGQKAQ